MVPSFRSVVFLPPPLSCPPVACVCIFVTAFLARCSYVFPLGQSGERSFDPSLSISASLRSVVCRSLDPTTPSRLGLDVGFAPAPWYTPRSVSRASPNPYPATASRASSSRPPSPLASCPPCGWHAVRSAPAL
ncbi:hypothetical protein C8Q76DRAFT_774964 [Earliella scabrosa]|nr:hypothetical protein C8Q76DRAFT_774964 [Earliella scabrosa]